jgi:hypothetical protein
MGAQSREQSGITLPSLTNVNRSPPFIVKNIDSYLIAKFDDSAAASTFENAFVAAPTPKDGVPTPH